MVDHLNSFLLRKLPVCHWKWVQKENWRAGTGKGEFAEHGKI
jgi:hypothetical protein